MRREGMTTVEAILAFVVGLMILAIVWALLSSSGRQGKRIDDRLSSTHAVSLLVQTLEPDVSRAESLSTTGGRLSLAWTLGREPASPGGGTIQAVCYSHSTGERVERAVRTERRGSPVSVKRESVGLQPFHRVTFADAGRPDAVIVSIEPLAPSAGAPRSAPTTFTLHAPLLKRGSHWPRRTP